MRSFILLLRMQQVQQVALQVREGCLALLRNACK
jgi:hypothetical protein